MKEAIFTGDAEFADLNLRQYQNEVDAIVDRILKGNVKALLDIRDDLMIYGKAAYTVSKDGKITRVLHVELQIMPERDVQGKTQGGEEAGD